jgi:sulfur carrier protein
MHILVNGKTISIADDSKLTDLIKSLTLSGSKIAVELNREIVPRSKYEAAELQEGDCVEIVQAIGGG